MQTTAHATRHNLRHAQRSRVRAKHRGLHHVEHIPQPKPSGLRVRVLETAEQRSVISELRKYAPIEVEQDLDSSLSDLEELKDRLGVVVVLNLGTEAIATIRAVPFGHGVTLAEKSWNDVTDGKAQYGEHSWEIGRLIVAPEHRSAELLARCLALGLNELIKACDARYLHASCSPLMARLYRRYGFKTEKLIPGNNALQHALIHADVVDVLRSLDMPAGNPVSPLRAQHGV